ncbi:Suppressor protein srp40 [Neofusicoccum parvum]|uniref:Suppressor protein srp40 n=1 Tax=Neofusicoccum parvum TaxID=310453 RepID=A0ACB5SHZ7_9PEZI|nr:Suppressor protein srp40 [Neofusicoccum parvum]
MSVTQALTDSSTQRNESASGSSAAPERTRLHITPFTPDLLKAFIPPSVLPQASAISYHSVQTFPEKGFGYVELPTMEAQKLKKKLNGSILKGQKVRIEDARPEKRKKIVEEAQAAEAGAEEEDRKAGKKVKKLKRKDGVLPGVELPSERHVKRGWTEPESKKDHKRNDKRHKDKDKDKKEKKHKSQPSKYTADRELLFKTKLPLNALPTAKSDKAVEKPKKPKTSSRDVVVHEFAKTTKHASFLKSSQVPKDAKTAAEFVEGKGWVDEEGNVVEQESESHRRRREAKAEAKQKRAEAKAAAAAVEEKKSKRLSALGRAEALEAKRKSTKAMTPSDEASEDEEGDVSDNSSVVSTSSSDVSSSSAEESEEALSSGAESEVAQELEAEEESSSESEPQSAHDEAADLEDIPHGHSAADVEMTDSVAKTGDADENEAKEVHPLEALFKRPKVPENTTPTKLTPIDTSFSFFGGGDDDEEAAEEANPPLTPYTRQDLHVRGIRSAAPTPDTAAIGKRFWLNDDEDEEEDDDEVEDSMMHMDANSVPLGTKGSDGTSAAGQGSEEAQQSDFAKHFWEHRGDYNRAWKKRRREAMKVQRQRENRRLGRKVI